MGWTKIDDGFALHKKIRPLSDAAFRLHVTAIIHATRDSTNGFMDVDFIRDLPRVRGTKKNITELVERGVWEEVDGGWEIHDYLDYNFSADQAERQRAKNRERQQRKRERDLVAQGYGPTFGDEPLRHAVTDDVTDDVTHGESHAVSHEPPSPFPSPYLTYGEEGGKDMSDRHLPDDWRPNDNHARRAQDAGLDIDNLEAAFRDHAREQNRRAKNWNSAFTAWITKATEFESIDRTTAEFDAFWDAYPRKAGKGDARTAWTKALRKTDAQTLIRAAQTLRDDPNLPEQRYIAHPATWLNGERWEDGPLPELTTRGADPSGDVIKRAMAKAKADDAAEEAARNAVPELEGSPFDAYAHLGGPA